MSNEIRQSKTVEVKRSAINFAPYNPRKEDPKLVEKLKKNFKKVGFLGGIVWNKTSGFLVSGHKRVQALDIINKYDGSPEHDYTIKVELVELDDKTEREQNIFMNSSSAQGEFDTSLLQQVVPEIDYESAGLTDADLNIYGIVLPQDVVEEPEPLNEIHIESPMDNALAEQKQIADEMNAEIEEFKDDFASKPYEERKSIIQDIKKNTKDKVEDENNALLSYIMLNFKTMDARLDFLEQYGFDMSTTYIEGEEFVNKIENSIYGETINE